MDRGGNLGLISGGEQARWHIEKGAGRTKVWLTALSIGADMVVYLYNENIHLGAVGVSQFDQKTSRVSTSVLTLLGHKDDAVAQRAAYLICKHWRKPVCVIAGIHVDNVTQEEIAEIMTNAEDAVKQFIKENGGALCLART